MPPYQDHDPESNHDSPPSSLSTQLDRSTVRKLDFVLLPFLSLLFLVNSLDRSNIGNAETAHFTRDTGLHPGDLNLAVAFFYAFFVILQPVGAAVGRTFGMSRYVPVAMTLWGFCTMLHIWISSKWQLVVLRSIIGALEAGFYPTTVSYLSLFYTRFEFGRRLGMFYGAAGVAGAFGGLLSYGIFSHYPPEKEETSSYGWKPWQMLFIIEGGFTMILAIIGFLWLPHSAETAWFLSPVERRWAWKRVRTDRDSFDESPSVEEPRLESIESMESTRYSEERSELLGHEFQDSRVPDDAKPLVSLTSDAGLTKPEVLSAVLFLPMSLPILVLNIASAIPSTAFSIFLPIVLSSMNIMSPVQSNLLTAPPFLLASATLFGFTYWSDTRRQRIIPIIYSLVVIIAGLLLALIFSTTTFMSLDKGVMLYLSLCILLSGSFVPSPLTVTWLTGNTPDPGKRAIVLGINGYGNFAGVLSALIFDPKWRDQGYRVSFLITLLCVTSSFLGFASLRTCLLKINIARAKLAAAWSVDDEELGADAPQAHRLDRAPPFAIIGGTWWDQQARYWIGVRILGMTRGEAFERRGDEKVTYEYDL